MNFLVHSYTCCSDRHASPYWIFIRRWISMGFTPSLLKNEWQNSVLLWFMLQAGPPSLHYYCAVVLHSCIVLPPVGHSSNREYHCCQLKRQSSWVSKFYRTFKIFIWLSLVPGKFAMFIHFIRHHHDTVCLIKECLMIWEWTEWSTSKNFYIYYFRLKL
jgi:hypothetical protein